RVVPGDEPAGVVRRSVADTLGLRAGIPVGAGTGDNMGAALALGGGWGRPVMSLGTSGTVYARVPDRIVDPSGTLAGFAAADAGFLPLAATLNCTQVVDRVAEWLGIDRGVVADDTSVVMLPYFDGERTPNRPDA